MANHDIQKQKRGYNPITCTVCGSDDYKPIFYIPPRNIVECKSCGHEYVNPIPATSDRDYFFPSFVVDELGTEIDLSYLIRILNKYDLVNCKLLDLGCGQGRLEQGLIKAGWDQRNLYLMDSSGQNLAIARKMYESANIIKRDAEECIGFKDYFDCVLMVEFLEDLANPRKVIENALSALKIDGLLIIRGIPNNRSLESFIGQDRWKMRVFEKHYHFFNPTTFSLFAENFPDVQILEFGCFLEEGYHFYNILRIAKDIGIIKKSTGGDKYESYDGKVIQTDELTTLVLRKLDSTDLDAYLHKEKISMQQLASLSSTEEIEEFFDSIHLDYLLSPDFSVVIRKTELNPHKCLTQKE